MRLAMQAPTYRINRYNVRRRHARKVDRRSIALDEPRCFFLRVDEPELEQQVFVFAEVRDPVEGIWILRVDRLDLRAFEIDLGDAELDIAQNLAADRVDVECPVAVLATHLGHHVEPETLRFGNEVLSIRRIERIDDVLAHFDPDESNIAHALQKLGDLVLLNRELKWYAAGDHLDAVRFV